MIFILICRIKNPFLELVGFNTWRDLFTSFIILLDLRCVNGSGVDSCQKRLVHFDSDFSRIFLSWIMFFSALFVKLTVISWIPPFYECERLSVTDVFASNRHTNWKFPARLRGRNLQDHHYYLPQFVIGKQYVTCLSPNTVRSPLTRIRCVPEFGKKQIYLFYCWQLYWWQLFWLISLNLHWTGLRWIQLLQQK